MTTQTDKILENSEHLKKIKSAITVAFIFFIVAYIAFRFTTNTATHEELGTLGDYIGGLLNPIIGFCAFLALLHTIEIQSAELKQSTEQLKESANALKEQSSLWNKQNFESSFFMLTSSLKEDRKDFDLSPYLEHPSASIIDNLGVEEIENPKGEQAFYFLSDIYLRKLASAPSETTAIKYLNYLFDENIFTGSVKIHTNKIMSIMKYVFRNIKNQEDIKFYLNILFDFLSLPERIIFSYYCLQNPESEEATIGKKYGLFRSYGVDSTSLPVIADMYKKYLL